MFNIEIPSLSAFYQTNTTDLTSLSAVIQGTESALLSARAALSSIPQHPYDIMKLTYFDKDHVFPTIDEIEVPANVSIETMQKGFEQVIGEYQDRVIKEITENNTPLTEIEPYSMLSELSSNGKWVTVPEKYRKYIEFFEVMRSVNVKTLTSADIARDIGRKFSYMMLQALTYKSATD